MAIISNKKMHRPNMDICLFEGIDFSSLHSNITSADDLISKYDLNTFPIDLNKIIADNKILLKETEFDNVDVSGALRKINGQYVILINKKHSKTRQNFTIAHELAHYFLHKDLCNEFEDITFFRGVTSDSIELQANIFAGELLMPANEFLRVLKQGTDTIQELAHYFGVSTLAIRVRAKQLNLSGHGL